MDFERLCTDKEFHIKQKMADGEDPTAVSCAKALTAFIENGKALLELAERESGEGRRRFVGDRHVIKIAMQTACPAGGDLWTRHESGQQEACHSLDIKNGPKHTVTHELQLLYLIQDLSRNSSGRKSA